MVAIHIRNVSSAKCPWTIQSGSEWVKTGQDGVAVGPLEVVRIHDSSYFRWVQASRHVAGSLVAKGEID